MTNPFRYFNSSPEVIRLVVMMHVKYALSLLRSPTLGEPARSQDENDSVCYLVRRALVPPNFSMMIMRPPQHSLDPTVVSPSAIWRQSMGNLASMSSSKRP
jgi:hypothetical protein